MTLHRILTYRDPETHRVVEEHQPLDGTASTFYAVGAFIVLRTPTGDKPQQLPNFSIDADTIESAFLGWQEAYDKVKAAYQKRLNAEARKVRAYDSMTKFARIPRNGA